MTYDGVMMELDTRSYDLSGVAIFFYFIRQVGTGSESGTIFKET